jgi:anti-sigma factor RsiW
MTAERCRPHRESIGAYLLGGLSAEEQAGLEAHIEGCPDCRAEAESLRQMADLLSLADPERVQAPASAPPPGLADRIAGQIESERRGRRRTRVRWRLGWAGAAAAAAATALIALVLAGGGGGSGSPDGSPENRVTFASVPQGVEINAALEPRSFGTQIRMSVHGVESGTLCRVYLRRGDGMKVPAGTFRYRYGDESAAVLSSALDLSQAQAIVVEAGPHTYSAPLHAARS